MNTYCNASCKDFALLAYDINSKIKLPLQDRSNISIVYKQIYSIETV